MTTVKWICVSLIALGLCLSPAPPAAGQAATPAFKVSAVTQPAIRNSAETVTAAQLRDYLSFVASDEMEGRADPSRGLDITAKFIATMLSRFGVKGAGDGGDYFQKIVLKKDKIVTEGTEVQLAGRKFVSGTDFLAAPRAGTVTGAMVFAGDGWFVKSQNIDAYKDVDPKGKIVIVFGTGIPPGVTVADLMNGVRGEDWIDPAAYAEKKGAIAVVSLNSLFTQASPETMDRIRKQTQEGSFYPEKLPRQGGGAIPSITANLSLAQTIFMGEKAPARAILMSAPPEGTPVRPFALTAARQLTISVKVASETVLTQNVVAVVEGSDPVLKGEYVALGAHYDHLGVGSPVNGDAIRNGADDDGSGTVALLAMAEALSKAPRHPKRSVLFVWHMGEEMGLWGSKYFTMFPTVPIDKIVAQLNIDMIGRSRTDGDSSPRNKDLSGPNEVYVIGSKMMSTELGNLSEAVNNAYLKMAFNYRYDDPKDPERFFYRSDHFNYALKNIPIIFYFTGVHADYHQPSDEVAKIDFQKFEKIARTIYATLWEIGELKVRPKVDKELPPEAKRGVF